MKTNHAVSRHADLRMRMSIIAGLVSCLAILPPANAAGRHCSNATLRGQYSLYREGTTPAGNLAGIGILLFDGRGTMMGMQDTAVNGVLGLDAPIPPSPYRVDEDCTAKFLFPNGSEVARVVIIDGGRGFYYLSMKPGNSVRGEGRRSDGEPHRFNDE